MNNYYQLFFSFLSGISVAGIAAFISYKNTKTPNKKKLQKIC